MNPTELSKMRVAVVGLGLMGGSMAMALHGKCHSLAGIDSNIETLKLAKHSGIFTYVSTDPGELLSEVDLLILAIPVFSILKIIPKIPEWFSNEVAVIDLGSTKDTVCRALDTLPDNIHAVGGHPMCGKEKLGFSNADEKLFFGATFALVPTRHTTGTMRVLAEQIVNSIGALPLWMDAVLHDQWVAATSHLPFLISTALTLATPKEVFPLVGSGFLSTTRLAATPAEMIMDVILDNRVNILDSIKRFSQSLMALERLLEHNDIDDLRTLLQRAVLTHQALVNKKENS